MHEFRGITKCGFRGSRTHDIVRHKADKTGKPFQREQFGFDAGTSLKNKNMSRRRNGAEWGGVGFCAEMEIASISDAAAGMNKTGEFRGRRKRQAKTERDTEGHDFAFLHDPDEVIAEAGPAVGQESAQQSALSCMIVSEKQQSVLTPFGGRGMQTEYMGMLFAEGGYHLYGEAAQGSGHGGLIYGCFQPWRMNGIAAAFMGRSPDTDDGRAVPGTFVGRPAIKEQPCLAEKKRAS